MEALLAPLKDEPEFTADGANDAAAGAGGGGGSNRDTYTHTTTATAAATRAGAGAGANSPQYLVLIRHGQSEGQSDNSVRSLPAERLLEDTDGLLRPPP